jgi:hypothetical protein
MAIATCAFATAVAAIAIPAWAASGGGGSVDRAPAPAAAEPTIAAAAEPAKTGDEMPLPPPALTRKERRRLTETAECLRKHGAGIPGVHTSPHGVTIGPNADRGALQRAAEACGAPPLPPRGAALPPGLDPAHRAKLNRRIRSCLPPRPDATKRAG